LAHEWRDGTILISDDRSLLDIAVIHSFLAGSYWSEGIPRDMLERSIANSIPFGVYDDGKQVGFARVITDGGTFAYLADVFVIESHRGRSLSKQLMRVVMSHPGLQGLRRWHLLTRDAHGLYRQFGFSSLQDSSLHMEVYVPDIYLHR
jgi:N-acetylglutamate synthase-like GNAT family acetyltransferase